MHLAFIGPSTSLPLPPVARRFPTAEASFQSPGHSKGFTQRAQENSISAIKGQLTSSKTGTQGIRDCSRKGLVQAEQSKGPGSHHYLCYVVCVCVCVYTHTSTQPSRLLFTFMLKSDARKLSMISKLRWKPSAREQKTPMISVV